LVPLLLRGYQFYPPADNFCPHFVNIQQQADSKFVRRLLKSIRSFYGYIIVSFFIRRLPEFCQTLRIIFIRRLSDFVELRMHI
jgi:hypothetical protein